MDIKGRDLVPPELLSATYAMDGFKTFFTRDSETIVYIFFFFIILPKRNNRISHEFQLVPMHLPTELNFFTSAFPIEESNTLPFSLSRDNYRCVNSSRVWIQQEPICDETFSKKFP